MKPNKVFELRLTETINRIIKDVVHPKFMTWDCQSPVVVEFQMNSWIEKLALEQVLEDLADSWKIEVKPKTFLDINFNTGETKQMPGVTITLTPVELEQFPDEAFIHLKDIKL